MQELTPGATLKAVASDLGVSRGALREWVDKLGSGAMAAATEVAPSAARPESQATRIVRLESENRTLRAEALKLETERDVLRQPAKLFAGETNW